MLTDIELESIFDRFIMGDSSKKNSAIQEIYEEFQPIMYKKLRRKFQSISEDEAQDIVQDAFLKLATTKAYPKTSTALVSWIFTISENTALDLFKKAYKKYELPFPDLNDSESEISCGYQESDSSNRNIEDCVSRGIERFSSNYPDNGFAISMSLDSISISNIASMVNRSEGGTRQYIFESKKKLASYIEHCREI